MSFDLTVPLIILGAVFLAGPFLLVADRRERRLRQQLALISSLSRQDAGAPAVRSIRREKLRFAQIKELGRKLFSYNPDFVDAYTLPIPIVIAGGALAGLLAGALASVTLTTPISTVIGCLAAGLVVRGLFGWQQSRYANLILKQIPDTLQFIVGAVRAGFPVIEAFRGISREVQEPTRAQFVRLVNEISLGRSVHEALMEIYFRTHVAEYAIFAVTLAVQNKTGGHLAETISTLAETVRERITIAARAKALAGEATVSATILSVLPVITGIALTVIRPDYLDPLFHDPRGKRMFLLSLTFLVCGIWTMRRMIAGAVKE
ncbi:MAG TPA: pilus assembly protein TadB [Acetobacteraceae bacterium]|jgi:tight adherence protein B|nr:pilus assembly protein TadB [Acetobacteraceae bacterium]